MQRLSKTLLTTALLLTSGMTFADGISISDPYVREVPPGQPNSASFMLIENTNANNVALVKATSDVAEHVEIHEHVHKDGMMQMRQVAKIDIGANATTELKPGGYHVMLIGLTRKIKEGDVVDIALEFDNGDKIDIKPTVKKVMMGMKKMGMKNKMKVNKHVNPMPNLMSVYKKMGEKLNVTDEQKVELEAGIKERSPKIKALFKKVMETEAALMQASLSNQSVEDIDQLTMTLVAARLDIIKGKLGCREDVKGTLDDAQFDTMVSLYRENNKPKAAPKDKAKAKMAMNMHTNPMPNLMRVVKKMDEKLNLSETQAAELKKWVKEQGPIMAKRMKKVMKLEAELNETALNNQSSEKIIELGDTIMQERVKIIRGKTLCRENMKRILDDEQFQKVISLYKENYMKPMAH